MSKQMTLSPVLRQYDNPADSIMGCIAKQWGIKYIPDFDSVRIGKWCTELAMLFERYPNILLTYLGLYST